MKESWLDNFASMIEDTIYKQTFRGSDDEIPSVIYDTIQILYKNSPMKPFIHTKRLIQHSKQLDHYKELAKDGEDHIPTIKELKKQLALPQAEDKNKKIIVKPQLNLPKHWTMEEILRWVKHKPKKKQTFFLIVHLPAGVSYEDFRSKEKYFSSAIGGTCEIERVGSAVYMTISNEQLQRQYNFNFDPRPYMKKMNLPILLGYSISGAVVVDLAELITILTGGLKGSGKSVLFHGAIYTLLQLNAILNKTHVLVAIIDPKVQEFKYFNQYGATWIGDDINASRQLLELLDKINTQRQNLIGGHANNILEWRALGNDLPFIVLFVDEIADMAQDATCKELLYKAVRKYRSQGIYVWSSTQRPSAKTWGTSNEFSEFKSQFEARISFRMADRVNSEIILDSDKAAYLPKIPGRCIFKYDTEQELQCSYFPSKAKNPELFSTLMSELPKIAVPCDFEDIKGEWSDYEQYYPRKRSQTRFESAKTFRSLKMLESGSYPHS